MDVEIVTAPRVQQHRATFRASTASSPAPIGLGPARYGPLIVVHEPDRGLPAAVRDGGHLERRRRSLPRSVPPRLWVVATASG